MTTSHSDSKGPAKLHDANSLRASLAAEIIAQEGIAKAITLWATGMAGLFALSLTGFFFALDRIANLAFTSKMGVALYFADLVLTLLFLGWMMVCHLNLSLLSRRLLAETDAGLLARYDADMKSFDNHSKSGGNSTVAAALSSVFALILLVIMLADFMFA